MLRESAIHFAQRRLLLVWWKTARNDPFPLAIHYLKRPIVENLSLVEIDKAGGWEIGRRRRQLYN
jgi:hypothetical protein